MMKVSRPHSLSLDDSDINFRLMTVDPPDSGGQPDADPGEGMQRKTHGELATGSTYSQHRRMLYHCKYQVP